MVAKITIPHRLSDALNYNEHKVAKGKAECIHASGFLRGADEMNFYQKMAGFENLNERNQRATTKTLHVSLNFDPSEKLSDTKLKEIAEAYMDKIGFGDQPYLVYKHKDAGHPHIHIVSTTIKQDGSRINTHNIGRNQSEQARKEIEKTFKLVRAENQKSKQQEKITPVNAEKVIYGKSETKQSISNVVGQVFNTYKFASLPEFNAALRQYNVMADRGGEDTRMFKRRGMTYKVLDEKGNKIGVPIKASSIYCKPTLANLEKKFEINKMQKEEHKGALKKAIDEALDKKPTDMQEFIKLLERQRIAVILRRSAEGKVYGITYIDNGRKVVFNGSDIGKAYSAAHIQFSLNKNENRSITGTEAKQASPKQLQEQGQQEEQYMSKQKSLLFDILLAPERQDERTPYQLLPKKRRRKRRSLGL